MCTEGLVWSVHGGASWKMKRLWHSKEGNSSIEEEKEANMTSLEEEYISLPVSMVLSSDDHVPFFLVLLAFLEVLCYLLHGRLFSG